MQGANVRIEILLTGKRLEMTVASRDGAAERRSTSVHLTPVTVTIVLSGKQVAGTFSG
jgi:hypothetical protein